ncbi:MAG TPA: PEP-CTERM sorting domain-containing protein [Fimbriimonadaceae bacterium]|nr:PEP-CTERM sorting domain-containing protein [Fimbriimonadaceae bacterium]
MFKFDRGIAVLAAVSLSVCSFGQLITLTDNGSMVQINPGMSQGDGLPGVNAWTIGNGPNNVRQQAYFYRVGGGAVDLVNNISAPNVFQPTANLVDVGYTSAASFFDLNFRYLLTGGPPNSSDLAEVATLTNRGNANLVFSLYEFDRFTPGGIVGGTGTLLNSSTIRHSNAAGSITVGATGIPDDWMIDSPGNVMTAIGNGQLTNATSGYTNSDGLAFAFQWNIVVAPGQTWQMSKDKLLSVPEPTSLLAFGGLAILAIRRRRPRR